MKIFGLINLFLTFSILLLLDGKTNFVLVMTDDQGGDKLAITITLY